ncbi:hypothetical protein SH528x_003396 [Novipirellula sp. SH528]|uniref:hypothetical protein n=1 Tax=Novipirellula sp. SH528 TaxID=3454466 RepID=UPI003FA098D1
MQDLNIPLLANGKTSRADCPNCGGKFAGGFAYIMGGGLLLSKDLKNSLHSDRLQGFMHVGFHGKDPDMCDSVDANVVDDVIGGQFDLQWCSMACMRAWLMRLLDRLEARLELQEDDA